MECFPTECFKTKTKVIITADQNKENVTISWQEFKEKTSTLAEAREKERETKKVIHQILSPGA